MILVKKVIFLSLLLLVPALASASPSEMKDPLFQLQSNLLSILEGNLGTAIALAMLIMGIGLAVAKSDPMPAITGVAMSAFLHFGPLVISSMVGIPVENLASNTPAVVASAASQPQQVSEHRLAASSVIAGPVSSTAPLDRVKNPQTSVASSATTSSQVSVASATTAPPVVDSPKEAVFTHTIPVPAPPKHRAPVARAHSSMSLATSLVIGCGLIGVLLVGVLAYVSFRQKRSSAGLPGFTPSQTNAGATSVFADPHGFHRAKTKPSFKSN